MANLGTINEILDFAMEKEDEAARFYSNLAARMGKPWMADVFRQFADEELKHKIKLEGVKDGRLLLSAAGKVADLKLADYLVDAAESPDMTYQDALLLAMQREKASFRLYQDLATSTDSPQLKDAFEALAQEEAKHKLRLEIEYDDVILQEN